MPVMDGVSATRRLRELHTRGQIDLTKTKIYMHSAIQETVLWEDYFDGKCKCH